MALRSGLQNTTGTVASDDLVLNLFSVGLDMRQYYSDIDMRCFQKEQGD